MINKDAISETVLASQDFHRLAGATLEALFDVLEAADANGALDVEYLDGAITFQLAGNKHYIISKHGVTKQLWLSSPLSGGLHFRYDTGQWVIPDGRTLQTVLMYELSLCGIAVNL